MSDILSGAYLHNSLIYPVTVSQMIAIHSMLSKDMFWSPVSLAVACGSRYGLFNGHVTDTDLLHISLSSQVISAANTIPERHLTNRHHIQLIYGADMDVMNFLSDCDCFEEVEDKASEHWHQGGLQ